MKSEARGASERLRFGPESAPFLGVRRGPSPLPANTSFNCFKMLINELSPRKSYLHL